MSETVPEFNYQAIQHFISDSPWEDGPVRAITMDAVDKVLGGTPYSGLLIDETAFSKKGSDSVGVARQWNGRLGKVDNCQVAVFSALTDPDHASLIDTRLYLPKEWTDSPERCRQAGVPEPYCQAKSKTQLALELIDEADANGVRYEWVGVDAGYGKEPRFLRELVSRGKTFFADVHKTQRIYLENPCEERVTFDPSKKNSRLRLVPKPITVSDWVAAQSKRKWKMASLRYGGKGLQKARLLHGRVWVWDGKEEKAHAWHLIVRRRGTAKKPDDKYTLSNCPEDTKASGLAWYQSQRFKIEQCFREAKQELSLDEYQVRGWRAWHHHASITMIAMRVLLEEVRLHGQAPGEMTLRDARELVCANLPDVKADPEAVARQIERRAALRRRNQNRNRGKPC